MSACRQFAAAVALDVCRELTGLFERFTCCSRARAFLSLSLAPGECKRLIAADVLPHEPRGSGHEAHRQRT
jgi:hypothetical protein